MLAVAGSRSGGSNESRTISRRCGDRCFVAGYAAAATIEILQVNNHSAGGSPAPPADFTLLDLGAGTPNSLQTTSPFTFAGVTFSFSGGPGPSALAKKFPASNQCRTRANQNQYNVLTDADREMEGSEMKRKGTIARTRETVLGAGRSAAERTKVLAGEVANAAATAGATAKAASTAAASAILGTVATSIQVRAAKGASALAGKGATTRSPAKKKVAKRVGTKKRTASKRKANTKNKVAKKKRV